MSDEPDDFLSRLAVVEMKDGGAAYKTFNVKVVDEAGKRKAAGVKAVNFHCHCQTVHLRTKVTGRWLTRSLADAVLEPFVDAYNQSCKATRSTKRHFSRIEANGVLVEDSTRTVLDFAGDSSRRVVELVLTLAGDAEAPAEPPPDPEAAAGKRTRKKSVSGKPRRASGEGMGLRRASRSSSKELQKSPPDDGASASAPKLSLKAAGRRKSSLFASRRAEKVSFTVTAGAVCLNAQLNKRWLNKPLQASVIEPFLQAHNCMGGVEPLTLDAIRRVEVDGEEADMSAAASMFVSEAGHVIQVRLWLVGEPEGAAEAGGAETIATPRESSIISWVPLLLPPPDEPDEPDEPDPPQGVATFREPRAPTARES